MPLDPPADPTTLLRRSGTWTGAALRYGGCFLRSDEGCGCFGRTGAEPRLGGCEDDSDGTELICPAVTGEPENRQRTVMSMGKSPE
jgi:hypothetical protein